MESGYEFEELLFDSGLMRSAAGEAWRMLSQLRGEIGNADFQVQNCPENKTGCLQDAAAVLCRLEAVCRGYEALLRRLEAAANVYGSASAAVSPLTRF